MKNTNDITLPNYKDWINKFVNSHDTREINFQNDVVKRLLEIWFSDCDIVYADVKGPDTSNHDYYAYSGSYIDTKQNEKPTTPDLLVCKNWDWHNVNNEKITYIATIEVKSPYGDEAIYKKEYDKYPESIEKKINTHLQANKINKVILTDTYKWEFFDGSYDNHEPIELVKRVKRGRRYEIELYGEDKFIELRNKLKDFFGINY